MLVLLLCPATTALGGALLWQQVPLWRMARMSWFIAWQVPIAQVPQVRFGLDGSHGLDGCGMTDEV